MGLSISGLLMQTLFRNPLAGPYVLGLSSGASLGVAAVILGLHFTAMANYCYLPTESYWLQAGVFVLMAVLAVSYRLRDTMAILIVGLMFGSLTSAIVGTLTYFSTAEQLQNLPFGPWESEFILDIHWILFLCVLVGLFLVFSVLNR
jgi:iron complex transport system permease protein